jgi:hypothetical protein
LGTGFRIAERIGSVGCQTGRDAVGSEADNEGEKKEMTARLAHLRAPAIEAGLPPVDDRPDSDQVSAPCGA